MRSKEIYFQPLLTTTPPQGPAQFTNLTRILHRKTHAESMTVPFNSPS